ncbi:kinase-like domain-containing protein [Mycena olivaceomarginata]|nr:kinase-like domain-containing protein [Mycena olivaceomarginata]
MLSLCPGSSCDVCLEPFGGEFKVPCSIACGHVFCVDCLRQLARPLCPLCRSLFDTGHIIRLKLDNVSPSESSVDSLHVNEGARQLLSRITEVATNGATEKQTLELIEECRNFLRHAPNLKMYSDLRTSFSMLCYIRDLKHKFRDQRRTVRQLQADVTSLSQEVDRLKAVVEALQTEKSCLEQTIVAERENSEREVPDFESVEFWASPNLIKWLLTRSTNPCQSIWDSSPPSSALERVQDIHLILNALPQNLATYAYSLGQPDQPQQSDELSDIRDQRESGFLASLAQYSSNVEILLSSVKQTLQKDSAPNEGISVNVYEHINQDVRAIVATLVLFLRRPHSYKELLACRGTEAQHLLDLLQDLLDLDSFSVVRPLLLQALLRLSRASGLHPRCFVLPELQKIGQQVAAGGFGDIWKGLVCGQTVSVKIMRIFQDSHVEGALKEFGREAVIWRQLCHPNLLPFFGLYHLDNRLCLISPWMENGNIVEFLDKERPDTDRRLSLILDVALGLQYLHENNVVHGDLKGLNILVTPSGGACISDFGLSSVANAITFRFTHSTASVRGGTARYQAPELFDDENPTEPHFGSDVYAFAFVCYQILTGKVPFHEFPNDMAVMIKVSRGCRPSRPPACSGTTALDSLWDLVQTCWEGETTRRRTMSQVVVQLIGPLIGASNKSDPTDRNHEFTSKFRRSLQAQPLLPSVAQLEHIIF